MPVGDLQRFLDAVIDGIAVLDARGAVEILNTEACRILETSAEAARGTLFTGVLGPAHPVSALVLDVLAGGRGAIESELGIEHRVSEDVVVDVAVSPLFEDEARPSGVVVMLRDRSIGVGLREAVSERERLAAFGQIAAGIAHEVKNPLGGIRGAAEILGSWAADAKSRDAAALIVREVDRIAALVDDLMVFTQGKDLRAAPVNIHRVLDDVLELLGHDPVAAGSRIERHFDPSIPELLADKDRLVQVFHNLVRNALQALEGRGGTLAVETRMNLDRRLATERGPAHTTVLVTVADDGPGIAPEVLEQLTTPFFTTRPDGTGLGLAVARHWVVRHGGVLRIESEPGSGTKIRVELPLRREESSAAGGGAGGQK